MPASGPSCSPEPVSASDLELAQQLFQVLAEPAQRHAGFTGLTRRIGRLLGKACRVQHVAVDVFHYVGLLQGGAGNGSIQRCQGVQGLVDRIEAGACFTGLRDSLP